jgi:hypothetical protein
MTAMEQPLQQFHFLIKFSLRDEPDSTFRRLSSETYDPAILTRNVKSMSFDRAGKVFELVFMIPEKHATEFEVLIELLGSFDVIYLSAKDEICGTKHFDIEKIIRSFTEFSYGSSNFVELQMSGIYK